MIETRLMELREFMLVRMILDYPRPSPMMYGKRFMSKAGKGRMEWAMSYSLPPVQSFVAPSRVKPRLNVLNKNCFLVPTIA